jgi:hypothetical protein
MIAWISFIYFAGLALYGQYTLMSKFFDWADHWRCFMG